MGGGMVPYMDIAGDIPLPHLVYLGLLDPLVEDNPLPHLVYLVYLNHLVYLVLLVLLNHLDDLGPLVGPLVGLLVGPLVGLHESRKKILD